jgi:hypothetical protein
MDAQSTARPRLELTWVQVPNGHGGFRLEMRWSTPAAAVAPLAPHAA